MKRCGFTLIEAMVIVAIIAVVVVFLYPVFVKSKPSGGRAPCQNNLKQVTLGIKMYVSDYDEKYPLVVVNPVGVSTTAPYTNPYGWADGIEGYLKSTQILHCPKLMEEKQTTAIQADPTQRDFTDYWYNRRLNGVEDKKLPFVANTILLGDGNSGTDPTDARYSKSRLPISWLTDTTKPSFRHLDGANYAFVDGHVKWLRPGSVKTTSPKTSYSFAIR